MIDRQVIEKIKSVARIVDVVSDFYQLRKKGVEWTCLCPFHNDKHLGNFKLNPSKNLYYCFACGRGGGPVDFLMEAEGMSFADAIRWLGKKYDIFVDEEQDKFKDVRPSKPIPIAIAPELPMLELPMELVKASVANVESDTLCKWINTLPWNEKQRERIVRTLHRYAIGVSDNGFTTFWQMDEQYRVRTGKMMLYKNNGHRNRDNKFNFDFVHSYLSRQHSAMYNPAKQQVKLCLFGLHLLNIKDWDGKVVNLVESEKTAVICAIFFGNTRGLWMACGGKQFFKRDLLQPLIDRNITIMFYPDEDGMKEWREKANNIGYEKLTFNNYFSRANTAWRTKGSIKDDAADYIVRYLYDQNENEEMKAVKEWARDHANEPFGTMSEWQLRMSRVHSSGWLKLK